MSDTVELRVAPTALQAGDTALVNRGGAPAMVAMGSAAAAATGDFATAQQGSRADTALQPGAAIPWADVTGKPVTFAPAPHGHGIVDVSGLEAALATAAASGPVASVGGATGAVALRTVGGQSLIGTGDIPVGEGGGGPVAWSDLVGLPTTLAGFGITDAATAAQGERADTALQPGAQIPWGSVTGRPVFAVVATSGAYSDLSGTPGVFSGAAPGLVPSPDPGVTDRFLRADGVFVAPPGAGGSATVGWTDVTDKPTTFPPAPHGHAIGDVTGLQGALDGKVSGTGINAIELISTAAYDGLAAPDPQTLYVKSDAPPSLAVVDTGGNPATPRPAGAVSVLWLRSPSEPTNAISGVDLWIEAN